MSTRLDSYPAIADMFIAAPQETITFRHTFGEPSCADARRMEILRIQAAAAGVRNTFWFTKTAAPLLSMVNAIERDAAENDIPLADCDEELFCLIRRTAREEKERDKARQETKARLRIANRRGSLFLSFLAPFTLVSLLLPALVGQGSDLAPFYAAGGIAGAACALLASRRLPVVTEAK